MAIDDNTLIEITEFKETIKKEQLEERKIYFQKEITKINEMLNFFKIIKE